MAESSMISGDSKHRPISFYTDEACRILYAWKQYQSALNISLQQINIRDVGTLEQFEKNTALPTGLSSKLDRYLVFSTFLLVNK